MPANSYGRKPGNKMVNIKGKPLLIKRTNNTASTITVTIISLLRKRFFRFDILFSVVML
jgi:hypothetical protein